MHILSRETCDRKPFCIICERYQGLRYHGRELLPTCRYNLEKEQIARMVAECPVGVIKVEQLGESDAK